MNDSDAVAPAAPSPASRTERLLIAVVLAAAAAVSLAMYLRAPERTTAAPIDAGIHGLSLADTRFDSDAFRASWAVRPDDRLSPPYKVTPGGLAITMTDTARQPKLWILYSKRAVSAETLAVTATVNVVRAATNVCVRIAMFNDAPSGEIGGAWCTAPSPGDSGRPAYVDFIATGVGAGGGLGGRSAAAIAMPAPATVAVRARFDATRRVVVIDAPGRVGAYAAPITDWSPPYHLTVQVGAGLVQLAPGNAAQSDAEVVLQSIQTDAGGTYYTVELPPPFYEGATYGDPFFYHPHGTWLVANAGAGDVPVQFTREPQALAPGIRLHVVLFHTPFGRHMAVTALAPPAAAAGLTELFRQMPDAQRQASDIDAVREGAFQSDRRGVYAATATAQALFGDVFGPRP